MRPGSTDLTSVESKRESSTLSGLADLMRYQWGQRAKARPLHYIASWKAEWSPAEFLATGEEDYVRLVEPILRAIGFDPRGRTAADVGCGAGRVARAFARRFGRVYAVDLSPEMLSLARTLNPDLGNVEWVLGTGTDLRILSSASLDCVFSYLVLHHVPHRDVALKLIAEMLRAVKPGGIFLFQFNSRVSPTMNLKGRLVWWGMDRLLDRGPGTLAHRVAGAVAGILHLDPLAGGSTWRGPVLESRSVLETVWANGGAVVGLNGWGTQMTWCYGRKVGEAGDGR